MSNSNYTPFFDKSESVPELQPYTPAWFDQLREINPGQALWTEQVFLRTRHADACMICGDRPVRDYRWNGRGLIGRLCADCKDLQERLFVRAGEALVPVGMQEAGR